MSWFLKVPLSLLASALVFLLAPVIALFGREDGTLPRWLAWAGTSDATLDGDIGWKTEHLLGWPRYLKRVVWLMRNPAYVFEEEILGASLHPSMEVSVRGNPWIKNREGALAGFMFATVGPYWCLKWITRPIGSRCLMVECGWKLQPYAQVPGRIKTQPKAQYVFSIRLTAFNQPRTQ